tara:strand:+ start:978 stop:1148 length:171 start_codon:yes stop_codon:yes gene_type:complete
MKKYDVKVDITFSKSIYVNAETEDEAKKLAEDEAYSHHHGEVIMGVEIIDIDTLEE